MSEEDRQWASELAVELVWMLSGRRYGLCELTVRPCGARCGESTYFGRVPPSGGWIPTLINGAWVNCGRCACTSSCSCCSVCEVVLPGPVHEVSRVVVDGQTVPASAYRVDNHRSLVRVDGGECWPACQDLAAPPDGPGAFTVAYQRGVPVPPGGLYAAGVYACELLKSCGVITSGECCQLPQRVQSITRAGVTMTMLESGDFLEQGRTGVPAVDAWIKAVNPRRALAPSTVYSPDRMPPRVTTWGTGA